MASLLAAPASFLPRASAGIDPEINTDSFDPVTEMYGLNEERRLDLIARQLAINYQMRWYAGLTVPCPFPFEPWPRVPGDIYGYQLYQPSPQPIGHESGQVAPNRWIYRPIYPGQPGAAVTAPGANVAGAGANAVGPELVNPNGPNGAAPKQAAPKKAVPQPKRRHPAGELPAPSVELPAPSDAKPGDFVPPTSRLDRRKSGRRAF